MTRNSNILIHSLYNSYYNDDRYALYTLFTKSFRSKYSFDKFETSRRFRRFDLGELIKIHNPIIKDENELIVPCTISIGGKEIIHNFLCIEEDDGLKVVLDGFFVQG